MESGTFARTRLWAPALLLLIMTLGAGAVALDAPAGAANPLSEPAPAFDDSGGDPPEVQERIIEGECELVDARGVPLYDSQFEQRTGSSPCDQH